MSEEYNPAASFVVEISAREALMLICSIGETVPHEANEHLETMKTDGSGAAEQYQDANIEEFNEEERYHLYENMRHDFETQMLDD